MNNRDKILKYLKQEGLTSPGQISEFIGISKEMTHRYLKKLVEENIIEKKGSAPKTYYGFKESKIRISTTKSASFNPETLDTIENNFTLLKPNGEEVVGIAGFEEWCKTRSYNTQEKAVEYVKTLTTYEHFKKNKVIDATVKLDAFPKDKRFLDKLYYLHPYSLPVFGKTKIAIWLFHAKQTQNRMLINRVFEIVIPEIQKFILEEKPESLSFIPPTVPRNIQIMKELQKRLLVNIPIIPIEKIKTEIMIQQKSLKDIDDRILNAEDTMVIPQTSYAYKKVLLLDDFTGSGATLNVLAGKLKQQNIATEVIGLTITGSMNGFEVIKEI